MHNVAQLRRLQEEFPDTLQVIGVHSAKFPFEKKTENIQQAVLREGIRHPVVNDADFKIWHAYNVTAWPTVVLIDPDGEIVGSEAGEIQADDYIAVLKHLIQEYEAQGKLRRRSAQAPSEEPAATNLLSFPAKVLADVYGRFFIADTHHHKILELRLREDGLSGDIVRVFGGGRQGLRDGPSHQACFNNPRGMALIENTLYVADTDNHAVRALDLETGMVRTAAGTGEKGMGRFDPSVSPTEIPLRSPWGLAGLQSAMPDGENVLLIAMAGSHQIWAMIDEERLGIFAGNGREALADGNPVEASFNQPSDLVLAFNHLIIADAEASAIRALSLTEEPKVFTLVGEGLFEFGDRDGRGNEVRLQHPSGIDFQDGLIYIADSYNHKIKTLDPISGEVKTLAGTGRAGDADGSFEAVQFYQPEGLAINGRRLYIADTNNHSIRVADLENRTVNTLKLNGEDKIPRNLPGAEAQVTHLSAVEVSPGLFTVTVNILLPDGYHFNREAPSKVTAAPVTGEIGEVTASPISAEGLATFECEAFEDGDLPLELIVYYCQSEQERLCFIENQKLVLPVRVTPGALDAVRLDYELRPDSSQ